MISLMALFDKFDKVFPPVNGKILQIRLTITMRSFTNISDCPRPTADQQQQNINNYHIT